MIFFVSVDNILSTELSVRSLDDDIETMTTPGTCKPLITFHVVVFVFVHEVSTRQFVVFVLLGEGKTTVRTFWTVFLREASLMENLKKDNRVVER